MISVALFGRATLNLDLLLVQIYADVIVMGVSGATVHHGIKKNPFDIIAPRFALISQHKRDLP